MIKTRVSISQADYMELVSDYSRWSIKEYAYWVAKFKSLFPAEGYGLYRPCVSKEGNTYYIEWEHQESCD